LTAAASPVPALRTLLTEFFISRRPADVRDCEPRGTTYKGEEGTALRQWLLFSLHWEVLLSSTVTS
jgi:hypothetical protein